MLKKMLLVLLAVVLLLVVFVIVALFRMASQSRAMDVSLGHTDGNLLPCPASPNCVSSQAPESDSHNIEPLAVSNETGWQALEKLLADMPEASLVARDESWAHYTFRTRFFGFVDDIEFLYVPAENIIHVRSASRVGHSDANANRKRVERIRAALEAGAGQ